MALPINIEDLLNKHKVEKRLPQKRILDNLNFTIKFTL